MRKCFQMRDVQDADLEWYLEYHATDDSIDVQSFHVVEEQNPL